MKLIISDATTGEVIAQLEDKTMTPHEQIAELKAALLDALMVVGWSKPQWFAALEGKRL